MKQQPKDDEFSQAVEAADGGAQPVSFEDWVARAFLCLVVGVVVYTLAGIMLFRLWRPDFTLFFQEMRSATIANLGLCRPEPQEQRLFLLVVFTSPFLLLLTWIGLSTAGIARRIHTCANAIIAGATGLLIALAIAAFAAKNPMPQPQPPPGTGAGTFDVISNINAGFYLYGTFVYEHPYLYALVLFPLTLWLLTDKRIQAVMREKRRWFNGVIILFATGLFAWMLAATTFRFPYTFGNKYDLSAVFYPMAQVYSGAQLLVDRFTDNYGLYPQFLLPIFRLTGLNFAAFSGTMALLTVFCFGILLWVLWRLIANRFLLLMTFASVIFYVYGYCRTFPEVDPYFANIPIRLVAPMAALGFSLFCRRGMSRVRAVVMLSLLALGILWCPDFGLMTYIGFTLFLGYLRFEPKELRRTFLGLGETLALSLATLLAVFSAYALIMGIGYGAMPDLRLLFNSMNSFAVLGMLMLPMPLLHPWNLMALTLAGGLLGTLPQLLRGEQDERSATLFLLTLLGVGTFSYYQGRSHNWNLLQMEIFVIPLWGVFADRLLVHLGNNRWLFIPLGALVFVLGTALPQLTYAAPALARVVEERESRDKNLLTQQRLERNAAFIRNSTKPEEKVQILTTDYYQGLYHGLAQRGSAFNPGYMDLFWRKDFARFLTFLRTNTTTKLYLEDGVKSSFEKKNAQVVTTILNCCYDEVDSNGSMLLLGKRSEEVCRSCLERQRFDLLLLQVGVPGK